MRRARKFLILAAAAGLIASSSAWVGVKLGRPLYYSDGAQAVSGYALAEAGMLRWSPPAVEFELPGPARGRVASLPDGRVLYGLGIDEHRTDLVLFDPRSPETPPQPVFELNSPGHDLAPCVGPGGEVLFASDRASGAGGFDLYRARFRDGVFFGVEPLPAGINTGLDESDPALDPMGGQLVFVRRDPELHDGRNGHLVTARLDDPAAAQPLYEQKRERAGHRRPPPIDRDPAFAPDGLGVYFVRETFDRRVALMRTFWHADHYVAPMEVGALQVGGPFRGPVLQDRGLAMRLVAAGEQPAVYRAEAREVYPFWEGQWWLEWLLLSLVLFFALLLLLLALGAHWQQLDVITKLLLLSMLIHLLLLLWMARMQIIRSFSEKATGEGAVEVHLVAESSRSGETGNTEVRQAVSDLSREMSFEGFEQGLEQEAPASQVESHAADRETAELERPTYRPSRPAEVAQASDRAADVPLREAKAAEARAERQRSSTTPDTTNRTEAARNEARTEPIRVVVPGSSAAQALASDARPRRMPTQQRQLPAAQAVEVADASLGDAAPAPAVRDNRPEAPGAAAALRKAAATELPVVAGAPAVASPAKEAADRAVPQAAPAAGALASAPPRRQAPVPVQPTTVAQRDVAPVAEPVRDAAAAPRRTGPAERAVAAAISTAGTVVESAQTAPSVAAKRAADGGVAAAAPAPSADLPARDLRPRAAPRAEQPLPAPAATGATEVAVRDVPDAAAVARSGPARTEAATEVAARDLRPVGAPATASADVARPAASAAPSEARAAPSMTGLAAAPSRRPERRPPTELAGAPRDVRVDPLQLRDAGVAAPASRPAATGAEAGAPLVARTVAPDQTTRRSTVPRPAGPAGDAIEVAAPRSDLATRTVRRAPGTTQRQLPSRRAASDPVADLRDASATTPVAAGARARPDASARPDVAAFQPTQRTDAASVVERGPSRSASGQPAAERLAPGSLLDRQHRRRQPVATRDAPARRATDAGLAALQDGMRRDAAPAVPAPMKARDGERQIRPALADLRRAGDDPGIAVPRRALGAGGEASFTLGIEVPGSYLERVARRVAAPVVVAAAPKLTPYANRFGANKIAALKQYGGDASTERAVQSGLAYLASIQNRDGTWGNRRESQRKYGQVFIGKTGLCLLAFLGAGHTPSSGTEYSDVVRRAVDALLDTQIRGTHFGNTSSYSHGITTYALAECLALTKDDRLRQPVQRAVDWILANQNLGRDRRNRGGWGYYSTSLRPEDGYARSSTSAWQVMALESAKLSGLEVPGQALDAARDYLLGNYDHRYRYFLYTKEPSRLRLTWRTLPASTPAAVFCLQLFGIDPQEDQRLRVGLDYTLARKPQRYRRYSDDDFVQFGAGNVYFWYYGSLACFMAGGETWREWNEALKKVLLAGQSSDGSFRPIDTYSEYAGDTNDDRSYTTAMCVLSLEVYYRYFTPLLKK